MEKRIAKQKWIPFLERLQKEAQLIAPVMTDKHTREFLPITHVEEVSLEGINPVNSPKEYLFPQTEKMYEFSCDAHCKASITSKQEISKQIILGIRPCDLHALAYQKTFFSTKTEDPYVSERFETTVLIGWACADPTSTCFCTSLGNTPVDDYNADIMMASTPDHYVFKTITPKGKQLIELAQDFFEESTNDFTEEYDRIIAAIQKNTEGAILKKVDLPSIKGKVGAAYNSALWREYSDACVACGACTYNCPTCTCFDVADQLQTKQQGCHYRTWDTCQNAPFTLHASGHNPRTTREERLRQRVLHKYHYSVEQLDLFSCTGCGRCTRSCPVGINMISIAHDIREVVDNGKE